MATRIQQLKEMLNALGSVPCQDPGDCRGPWRYQDKGQTCTRCRLILELREKLQSAKGYR